MLWASAMGIAAHTDSGASDQFYFLTIYCIGVFFLGGQLFRESLLNALHRLSAARRACL